MLNCEYLVYNADHTDVEPSILDKAYEILISLPYPMCNSPLNTGAIARLTKQELDLLKSNEPELIRNKIAEIDPKLRVAIIPKSMQQFYLATASDHGFGIMFFLSKAHTELRHHIADIKRDLFSRVVPCLLESFELDKFKEEFQEDLYKLEFDGDLSEMDAYQKHRYADPYSYALYKAFKFQDSFESLAHPSYTSFMEALASEAIGHDISIGIKDDNQVNCFNGRYYAANSSDTAKKVWCSLNKALCAELLDAKILNPEAKEFKALSAKWLTKYKNYCQFQVQYEKYEFKNFRYRPDKIEQLFEVLCFEIDCMFNPKTQNLYILYRGSPGGPISDLELIEEEPDLELSFSNGILEGISNDPDACSWIYYGDTAAEEFETEKSGYENNVGYALLFNPNSIDASLLRMPTAMNFLRVFGHSYDFHPRHLPTNNSLFAKLLKEQTVIIKYRNKIAEHNISPETKEVLFQYIANYRNAFREPILQESDGKPRIKSKL